MNEISIEEFEERLIDAEGDLCYAVRSVVYAAPPKFSADNNWTDEEITEVDKSLEKLTKAVDGLKTARKAYSLARRRVH